MTKKNPAEILAELISMRKNAGANLYIRLNLANQLLSSLAWVEDPAGGGGDASRAIDRLEQDCFGPEAGMSLPAMLEVLAAFPQESVWKQQRYNLHKMWEEVKERQRATRKQNTAPPKASTPAQEPPPSNESAAIDLENECQALKQELKAARKTIKEQEKEIRKLRLSLQRMKRVLDGMQLA